VIPVWLRRQFQIEDGTPAIVSATEDGILLKPVTKHAINRLRGILKRKSGDKPFAEEWAEHKRQEKELEEAKDAMWLRAKEPVGLAAVPGRAHEAGDARQVGAQ
jgi:bifunctional DNA-binding transcriptional regulator/antitoxin component of YhaV-PrlF toxin-antitoxin module